ncbi:MAG: DUF3126 family protein [Pseudomonadota bacterium]
MTQEEIARLIRYLREKFGNDGLSIKLREKAPESAEVMLDGEFIGVIYKDTDEGEVSYDFNMAILDFDLPAAA